MNLIYILVAVGFVLAGGVFTVLLAWRLGYEARRADEQRGMKLVIPFLLCLCLPAFGQLEAKKKSVGSLTGVTVTNPNTPDGISGLLAWYSATNVFRVNGSAAAANQEVALWKNQVADAHHFTNSPANSVYATNRAGGACGSNYIVISPDASGFSPGSLTNNLTSTSSNFTVFAVMQVFPTALFNNERVVFGSDGQFMVDYAPDNGLNIGTVTTGPQTVPVNTWMAMAFVNTITNATIYTNGVAYVSQSYGYSNLFRLQMGIPGANACQGNFEEILVYDKALSAAELAVLQAYYTTKFCLP
jgi:hypothetical protein